MTNNQLHYFTKMTEFLGRVLGPDYEVALHDISHRDGNLVAIANNTVSNRTIGAPLTESTRRMIEERVYESKDYVLHRLGATDSGKPLSSSTMFIKDENGELLGLLCITFDDSRYRELSQKVFNLCHPDTFVETNFHFDENRVPDKLTNADVDIFHSTIDSTATTMVNKIIKEKKFTGDKLTLSQKMIIIEELDSSGAFLVKGAVKDVAAILGCSQATIYRYLSNVKK